MNQMDPGFSNTHFYKWGWFVAVELNSIEGDQTSKHGSRKQRRDRRSGGPTHRRKQRNDNPAASVGRLYILPTVLPWKSTKCRFSYTNHGCVMGIYEKSPKFHETQKETLRWFYKSFQCGGELNLWQLHIDGLLTEVGRNSDFPTKLKNSSLGAFWC